MLGTMLLTMVADVSSERNRSVLFRVFPLFSQRFKHFFMVQEFNAHVKSRIARQYSCDS